MDAHGCDAEALRSVPRLQQLFAEVIAGLGLHAVAESVWHAFPGGGGVTGMVLLSESHLHIHTYPEAGFAAVNLYCCRDSAGWPWEERLHRLLGAQDVEVRIERRGR